MSRRLRNERRPGVRIVLGSRDEALLRGLSRFRVATTGQLVRLFFRGIRKDTASARLRRLFDASLLDIAHSALNTENVYAIGAGGRRWLEARGVASGGVPRGPLDHHLGIVEAWVGLAATLHGNRSVHLSGFMPDWECRRQLAGTGALVVPDADVSLSLFPGSPGERQVRLVLEVDLGTERHGALASKLAAYAADHVEEGVGLVVILADAGERRLAAVRGLVEEHWPSWSLVCRQVEWPNILLAKLGLADAAPPTAPPCGEGRSVDATSCAARVTRDQGEGPSRSNSSMDERASHHATPRDPRGGPGV